MSQPTFAVISQKKYFEKFYLKIPHFLAQRLKSRLTIITLSSGLDLTRGVIFKDFSAVPKV